MYPPVQSVYVSSPELIAVQSYKNVRFYVIVTSNFDFV